jgi:hypothetical protein
VGASGAAYVFDLSGPASTSPILTLPNPDPVMYDSFGWSVAISESLVVVGAPGGDFGFTDSGGAYAFDLTSSTPSVPIATLRNPDSANRYNFGYTVAIDATTIAVGAPYDNGETMEQGAAYAFGMRPTLNIAPGGPGYITISWTPSGPTGFVLQHAEKLDSDSDDWSVAATGSANPVTLPIASSSRFYRLVYGRGP